MASKVYTITAKQFVDTGICKKENHVVKHGRIYARTDSYKKKEKRMLGFKPGDIITDDSATKKLFVVHVSPSYVITLRPDGKQTRLDVGLGSWHVEKHIDISKLF